MTKFSKPNEPIAVVGTACRFPGGCNTPSKLWDLVCSSRDVLQKVPPARFNVDSFYHNDPTHHGTTNVTHSYFLDEDVTKFDNGFFGIQHSEAEAMDPQQRLLLETVYDSVVDAGLSMEDLKGSDTSVFVGQMCDDWAQMLAKDWDDIPTYMGTGVSRAVMSNRISYFACSSSLVAVHEAVRTLRSGESNVAVAAGANLILLPGMYICESKLRMISPTGRSRMWDANADGYARGEGFASVILKTLSQALADGDPIECIIRETGVNQDGKTPGLTVPSNFAQTALIRDVYQRAGLNITKPSDRPQLFHAHGTGTKAGDPKEAEAISKAFFSDSQSHEKLSVISIKTQIGHTEGTAGLASLLGTMMAMKNAIVPPNMHFETLNPDIEPFYDNLEVPTSAKAWPSVHGGVKRASINSFGFGGTNAHAILESYEPALHSQAGATTQAESPRLYSPLLFSANSEKALREVLSSYLSFLEERQETNMADLAWTLSNRRSTLPYRSSVVVPAASGSTQEAARSAILAEIERLADSSHKLHRSSSVPTPKIIGVFTGQGAQWPRMGAALLESSTWARAKIAELDGYLAELPSSDVPDFTLESELLALKETSRVAEAAISQPLCTAVQVILVDLIRELAGIQLTAVVGHSSGEIAAAYAAGFMTRRVAIVTAYYRGRYAKLAASPSSSEIKGAMAAVGTDEADALEFCALEDNAGRISVAAVNGPSSVTLSGDEDAIEEAIAVFQDEGKFARRLKVDTAYHSSHMQAAAGPYLEALQRSGVRFDEEIASEKRPLWFSSTKVDSLPMKRENLSPQYWIDNMVKPVMFAPALECALAHSGPFDMALELGPHPALKGPALESLGSATPYQGVLTRGRDDIESVAECIGAVWRNLGRGHVDFASIDATLSGRSSKRTVVRDLPPYPFSADAQVFWSESRFCAALRQMDEPVHPILGRRMVENSVPGMTQWRNILRAREIPWLRGHRLQGQVIFPGCGYAAMALEATMILARDLKDSPTVRLLSLYDLTMDQAIVFNDDSSSVETLVTMKTVESSHDELVVDFVCCSYHTHGLAPAVTSTHAHGRVVARLGAPSPDAIPGQTGPDPSRQFNLAPIEIDRFYTELAKHGYQYSPPFKGIVEIERKSDFAIGKIVDQSGPEWEDQVALAHPGLMDSGVQTVLAAMAAPGDGRLWCLQMLVGIDAIHVNPYFASVARGATMAWEASTTLGEDADSLGEAVGDMRMLSPDGQQAYITVEGARMRPFTPATAANDSPLFSTWIYGPTEPDGVLASRVNRPQEVADAEIRSADNLDRLSLFYVRRLAELVPAGSKAREEAQEHFKRLLTWCDHVIGLVSRGEHHFLTPQMMNDTQAEVDRLLAEYANSNDFRLTHAAAKALLEVVPANEGNVHEYLTKDNMLNRYYEETLRYEASDQKMYNMMRQLAHIYPQMRILEVGAGTGGATSHALPAIDGAFSVYTFTDISTAFFDKAEEKFKDYAGRINFKALDMNTNIEEQGFTESSYHVVMAGMALHATGDVEGALRNVRRLLKPGGRLIGFENINNDAVRLGIGMGGFAAWWSGAEYGRPWGPMLTLEQWDDALKRTGFTGVDTHTVGHNQTQPMCLWVSMARDEKVDLLREPLTVVPEKQQSLVVVGGKTFGTMDLVEKTKALVAPFYQTTNHFKSVEALNDITEDQFPEGSSVLCLTELDEPVLRTVTDPKLDGLKTLWARGRNILWVTKGAASEQPYNNMVVSLARSIRQEYPSITLQTVDLDNATVGDASWVPSFVAAALRRIELLDKWKREEIANGADLSDKLQWTQESEVRVVEKKSYMPRLNVNKALNHRFNSIRRVIHEDVDPQSPKSSFSLNGSANTPLSTPVIGQISPLRVQSETGDTVPSYPVRIRQSLLQALRIGTLGYFRLCVGDADGKRLLTLTPSAETPATTPQELTVALPAGASDELSSVALLSTAAHLVAAQIATLAPQQKGSHIIIHDADPLVRTAIMNMFESHPAPSWRVSFTGCLSEGQQPQDLAGKTTWLAPELTSRAIRKLVPSLTSASLLVDFSAPNSPASVVATTMAECLPWYARTENSLVRNRVEVRDGDLSAAKDALQAAWTKASSMVIEARDRETIPLNHIESFTAPAGQSLHLVDWTTPSVPVRVHPLDHHTNIFRSDKTYLLVGLSGEMGQSCCEWMAAHGARYVVLTSRDPKVDQRFIDNMENAGVTVVPRKLDITSKESLHLCYNAITRTLPPIAGVANGAMLLQDVLFKDMDAANLNKVLAPKVNGSIYLDELFADTKLDFFLMFSSAASIVGSRGQANYAAANMFMASLVNNRRKRGLPASIINISALIGLGYIERQKIYDASFFKDIGIANTSAQGLHQLIAEAILAGQRFGPDEDIEGGEISQGIMPQFSDDEHKSFFIHDSKFSNMLIERVDGDADVDASGNAAAVSLSRQLKRVTSKDQALRVITDAFTLNLKKMLRIPVEADVPETLALVDQGVDSLVAVDVRSWFLKELDTDMPVLKILGGNSIIDLASDALERIPKALLDLDRDDDEAGDEAQPMNDKKIPETSGSSSSSDVMTGDSDALSQSSATDISTTAKSTAGADTASIPPSLSNMKNNNGPDDRHEQRSIDEAAKKQQREAAKKREDEEAAKRREEIVKTSREVIDEMSLVQSRFWFLTTALEDKTTFNVTISAHLKGRVDVGKLGVALEGIAKRHEILRTRFFFGGKSLETPMQGVLSKPTVRLTTRQITSKADVDEEMEWLHNRPWNLGDWETIKLALLSQSDTEHWLVLAFHHIAMDGYSLEIFWRDLAKAYNANGSIPTLPDAKQYRAYTAKQRRQNLSKPFEWRKAIEFYRKLIMPEPEPLPLLPFAKVSHRKLLENYSCYNAEITLEPSEAARIRKLAKANHATSFHVYVAALQTLLFGLMPDSVDRLFIAMDDTNRLDKDFMDTIGLFVNTLFLRFDRSDYNTLSFSDAIRAARTKTYKALEHSVLPLDVLLKELCITRHGDAVPVAQVLIDYRVSHKEWFRLGDCTAEMGTGRAERQGSDLAFYILDDSDEKNGGSVRVGVEVQSSLYDGEHAEMLIRAYTNLLRKVTADDAGSKMALKALPPWAEDDLSISLGPTMDAWPEADTLSHRIEAMTRENPSAPALNDETSQLTYEQMGHRIDEIADTLISAGLKEGDFIGVFQETGVDWICSMLAILKLGMTYVPLYPPIGMPRLAANVQVAQPQAVLVDNSTADRFDQLGTQSAKMIHVPTTRSAVGDVPIRAQPSQKAMILCTSGSTGIPKAVVHTHRSLKALVEPHVIVQEQDKPSYAARVLQQSAFSFDLSIDQTMLALCNGGCVFVVPNSKRGDPLGTVDMIARHKITYTMCTPSEYSIWHRFARDRLLDCTAWENASSSGGPLPTALVRAFAGLKLPHLRVFNHCGPTETTVTNRVELNFDDYAEGEMAQMRYVTDVGFPCANYSTYIVDENMKLLPRGYPGEIVVGGAGVADGYLGRPDLTKEKFIPDPWTSSKEWKTMYRTGDRGKLRANGMVDILGRIEGGTQVKLRGYRIELGDVESAILSTAQGILSDAVVTLRYPKERHDEHDDDGFLVAHVVVADKSLRRPEVDSFLRKIISKLPLPHYMLPALMLPIDRFPLTAHQKPDRSAIAALPLPAFTHTTAHEASEEGSLESETQKKIAKMWRTLVPASSSVTFTTDTDFFHVGGSSLLLIKLQGMIRKEFNVSLRLLNLMAASKLREMAALVNDEVSGGDIDWERETRILDEWLSLPQGASQKMNGPVRVLVTGSTGFLGRNLVSHLADSPQVSEIHCLVRDESTPETNDKVTTWRGDLSQPNLGLSDTDFSRLSNSIDAIIHCGANRSFWDDYRSLRAINVTSVAELIRLSLPRRLPVHVLSSGAVKRYGDGQPPADGSDGYVASKWAAEGLLRDAATRVGLPVFIHRPAPTSDDAETRDEDTITSDELLRLAKAISLRPDPTGLNGTGHFAPIDQISRRIIDTVLQSSAQLQDKVHVVEHAGTKTLSMGEFAHLCEQVPELKELPTAKVLQWFGKAKKQGLKQFLTALEVEFSDDKGDTAVMSR
ncbi:polyketide synthase [Fusarium beomiforme]|uniref:Polyketide synthase n=1 Tax=Fusarium beomiforme TaxID=44412 RepID=A0A9P5DU12_9HYPO|nr:polyketide synthase [Fusarium beomiforme]